MRYTKQYKESRIHLEKYTTPVEYVVYTQPE